MVLARSLRVLTDEGAAFKVVASQAALSALNEGRMGLSQIGKFITVYPADDVTAVRVASKLDRALSGLRGPEIPSDRPLRHGSLVHYRFGGFQVLVVQTPLGEIVPAVSTPSGEVIPDVRGTSYSAPEWVSDPFVAAGVAGPRRELPTLLRHRFLIVAALERSARGEVYATVDLNAPQQCVVKRARHDAAVGAGDRDACERLRHEADVLRSLAPDRRFPAVLDEWDMRGDHFLAMSELGASTLEQHVHALADHGRLPAMDDVLRWGRALARALASVHGRGWVHGDVKAANAVFAHGGGLGLIDFELAEAVGTARSHQAGTYGHLSPERLAGAPPVVQDDIYALGAVLRFAATAADPSLEPEPLAHGGRSLRHLNPQIDERLVAVIERCLARRRADRYESMTAVDDALVSVQRRRSSNAAPAPARFDTAHAASRWGRLAQDLGDRLAAEARRAGPSGRHAMVPHEAAPRLLGRDLDTGLAGAVLALADLVEALDLPEHELGLRIGATRLANSRPVGPVRLPGLYVGESGVAIALMRAARVLGDGDLRATALGCGASVATMPHTSPDVYHGSAGRLESHLRLWRATGDMGEWAAAHAAAEAVLSHAERQEDGSVAWTIPPGYGSLSDTAHFGYAHGAAGIADALLSLWSVNGDPRLLAAVRDTVDTLAAVAVPALNDGSGRAWPLAAGQQIAPAYWCHGAGGIAAFLLRAAGTGAVPHAQDLALRAVATAAHGTRWCGPSRCHGVAGTIGLLLAAYSATGDPRWLCQARAHGALLEQHIRSLLRAPAAGRSGYGPLPPGLMTGYAGIALIFLRLSSPNARQDPLPPHPQEDFP